MAAREEEFKSRREFKALCGNKKSELFLPNDLDVESLTYGSLGHLFDFSRLDLHSPCKFDLGDRYGQFIFGLITTGTRI